MYPVCTSLNSWKSRDITSRDINNKIEGRFFTQFIEVLQQTCKHLYKNKHHNTLYSFINRIKSIYQLYEASKLRKNYVLSVFTIFCLNVCSSSFFFPDIDFLKEKKSYLLFPYIVRTPLSETVKVVKKTAYYTR